VRKLVVTMYVTLDGVMEAPNKWSFQNWNSETQQFKFDELFASDALLLGRVTYEGFSAAWPAMKDELGFADRMNSMPKHVVSTTLTNPTWNATVIKDNVAEQVAALKQQPGQDILLAGSADLVNSLMPLDLIDEYRLLTFPVVVGGGKRLFREGTRATLKLVDTRSFSTGIVLLTYEPDRK
jgi:dihydrofolate reductase